MVTIVNATGETITTNGVALQEGRGVRVTPASPQTIRNRAGVSALDGVALPAATAESDALDGTYNAGVGTLQPPQLVSFVASDPDGGDFSYGVGDQLVLTFRGRSNLGANMGGQDFVDSLFDMVPALGSDCERLRAPSVPAAADHRVSRSIPCRT